jgi:chromate transporter
MVPLINAEMVNNGWMTTTEVLDIVAIAEMTPGPLGINCATFAGIRIAGILGALFAVLGILMPTLTLCLFAAIFFERFQKNKLLQNALAGIRPTSVGLIAATVATLSLNSYFNNMAPNITSISIGIIISLLIYKFDLSIPKLILIAAVLGLILEHKTTLCY